MPARLVCDNLGVMDLVSVQVVHWPSTAQAIERAFIKHEARVDSLAGKRVLVIDDIVDTGGIAFRWPRSTLRRRGGQAR